MSLPACDATKPVVIEKNSLRAPEKIDDAHLENAFKFTDKVWGGAEPHGADAFRSLKERGVKTIVSVDGAKPNVEMARNYGLKYVHLPIGYDEVPSARAKEIAKAFSELGGPIFVHCHHGKHRSPAALATACIVNGMLSTEEALLAMKTAGTGESYRGLWESAREAKRSQPAEIANLKVTFLEQAPIPPMAEAMVGIDMYFEHLRECKQSGWNAPKNHPDLDPAHEALKLRESFVEMLRLEAHLNERTDFNAWTERSLGDAEELETRLRAWNSEAAAPREIDAAFQRLEKNCKDCHAAYRNVRQGK